MRLQHSFYTFKHEILSNENIKAFFNKANLFSISFCVLYVYELSD